MPTIFLTNKSGHPQTFEVHGWNGNRNITVPPHHMSTIPAGDKTSGAIIALHEGHEGEQAEITFNGFGGNDFFDMSNIVGAGGNMTIQQQGEPSTRKGDPFFMQNLRKAWHKLPQHKKNDLKGSIFLDNRGEVKRMGPIKGYPKLEAFVRTFADGKTYIGVGAWNGSPGNANDNNQSSAAKGTKNSVITYSDGKATPDAPGGPGGNHAAHSMASTPEPERQEEEVVVAAEEKAEEKLGPSQHDDTETLTANAQAAPKHPGPGIDLRNKSNKACTYFFYDNYWNGNGRAGANFDKPLKSCHLAPHSGAHVPLPTSFKGRVQRGKLIPATWAEFQIEASNDHAAHGDISLQQGCDGAATIASTDGSRQKGGFEMDVVTHAPDAACMRRSDGVRCLASTMGNWMGGPNKAAADWLFKHVGQKNAYILGGSGTDDVRSTNKRMEVCFF